MLNFLSILFDDLIQLLLASVVLFHDYLFLVAAEHWKVRFYVHWVVDAFLKCLKAHFVHFFKDLVLGDVVGHTSLVCHVINL